MFFGGTSFAELPWATSGPDTGVIVNVNGNQLNITIGSVGIIATAIIEDPNGSQVTLGTGALTITGDANFTVTGNATTLGIGNFVVTAAANVNVTGNTLTLATGNATRWRSCYQGGAADLGAHRPRHFLSFATCPRRPARNTWQPPCTCCCRET